jgi:outer membrane protein TolC
MKPIFLTTLMLLNLLSLSAQSNESDIRLSLNECVQMAVEKNINVQTARIDRKKNSQKVSETLAAVLPKVSIGGAFQDNLKLPTTMLDGTALGRPGMLALQMGVHYNTNANITVNQVLYNQTALTALQLSKEMDNLYRLGIEKASEEIILSVSKLYFLAVTTAEQKSLIEANIDRAKRMTDITKTLVDNGVGKQVDYDRITVALENLYTQRSNTEALHEQQLNMIKYMLEIPNRQNIVLTDTAALPLLQNEKILLPDFSNHIDIQMLEKQTDIALLNRKMINSGYLPTLSFTGQSAYQGLRTEFKNYFNGNSENKWFASSYIGINLSIPVFDGLEKRSKSRQAKLEYQKSSMMLDNTKERLDVDCKNAMNNYNNHKMNVQRQEQNIKLAEKVYAETTLKYREGLATMSDLLQDENGLSNAQASYLNALYSFKEAELQIMSVTGRIKELIQNSNYK